MNQKQKVKQAQLRTWYHSHPKAEILTVRNAICHSCGVNMWTFYNWLSGVSPIPTAAQIIMNQMAEREIFEVPETIKLRMAQHG